MPSYAIHLAIANEIIRKNKNNIKDKEKLINGSIMPDLEKMENTFHTGLIEKYIQEGLRDDYDKGYFLHLLADEKFYFFDFKEEFFKTDPIEINNYNNFYSDFNKITSLLVEKYKIERYPIEIEKYMQCETGKTEYIKLDKLYKFIDEMSDVVLDDIIIKLRRIIETD